MLWIPPPGLERGFSVLSDGADALYKATDFYYPEAERTVLWNDSHLCIDWQMKGEPIISAKDRLGVAFSAAETFE